MIGERRIMNTENNRIKYFADDYSNNLYRNLIDNLAELGMSITFDPALGLSEKYPFEYIGEFCRYFENQVRGYERVSYKYAAELRLTTIYDSRLFNFMNIRYKDVEIKFYGKYDIEISIDVRCVIEFRWISGNNDITQEPINKLVDIIARGNIFEWLTKDKLESRKYYIDLQ